MEWLKELLEAQAVDEGIIAKVVAGAKDFKFIPKERFDEVNEQKKELQGQLTERDTQLKDISKQAKGNEELQAQIADLQAANEQKLSEYEGKIKNITIDSAIKLALKGNKAKYEDLLVGKFDREKLEIAEDGTVKGIDEQLNNLKEGYSDLFTPTVEGTTPKNIGTPSKVTDPFLQGFNS